MTGSVTSLFLLQSWSSSIITATASSTAVVEGCSADVSVVHTGGQEEEEEEGEKEEKNRATV